MCYSSSALLEAILRLIQTESVNSYANAHERNPNTPICIHPLLLSLNKMIAAAEKSETEPDIRSVSENDERAVGDDMYTSPSTFPPLEMHFFGKNGLSLLSYQQ